MSKLKKQLQEEKIRLETILKTTEERLVDAPEGKLRIAKSQGKVQYYHRRKDTSNTGSYISCIFRKNCASVPEERSAIPLQTEQSSAG